MCEASKTILVEERKTRKWLVANAAFLMGVVFFGGAWMRGIEKDVEHVQALITVRTEDRFYAQDGLILEQRIIALENNYSRIESSLIRLEDKY